MAKLTKIAIKYREGNLPAAQALMDSPDNACLTAFPTAPAELHLSESDAFYLYQCDTAEDGNVIGIRAELRYTNDLEPEGLFGNGLWMLQLQLARMTRTDDAGNSYDAWCISSFKLS